MAEHTIRDIAVAGQTAQTILRLCGQANLSEAQAILAFSIALTSWKHCVQGNDMTQMTGDQIAEDTAAIGAALTRIVTGASAH